MLSGISRIYSGRQCLDFHPCNFPSRTDSGAESVFSLFSYNINGRDSQKVEDLEGEAKEEEDDLETLLEFKRESVPYDDTGRRVYENACQKFGIVPCSNILKSLSNGTSIDLKHYGLGPKGAKALSFSLCVNSNITSLILRGTDLGNSGMEYIQKMMIENVHITELDIAENGLGRAGAVAISEILYYNRMIRKLDISGNNFTDTDSRYITVPIESHTNLTSINFSHNRFGDKSSEDFERMIAENNALEEIDLSWNEFRMAGAARLASGMAENIYLKRLNVSWNGSDDDGAIAFGEALEKNGILQELDLTCNRIGPDGFIKLLNCFKKNTTLETLRLGKNNIADEAARLAVDLLITIDDLELKLLDLTDVILSDRFEAKIEELKEAGKEVNLVYGYSDSYGKCKLNAYDVVRESLLVIQSYLDANNMKLVDLFSKFDADGSMSVSHDEFKQGLKESGITLTPYQVERLINYVDEDGDGEIEFSELVVQTQEKMKGN